MSTQCFVDASQLPNDLIDDILSTGINSVLSGESYPPLDRAWIKGDTDTGVSGKFQLTEDQVKHFRPEMSYYLLASGVTEKEYDAPNPTATRSAYDLWSQQNAEEKYKTFKSSVKRRASGEIAPLDLADTASEGLTVVRLLNGFSAALDKFRETQQETMGLSLEGASAVFRDSWKHGTGEFPNYVATALKDSPSIQALKSTVASQKSTEQSTNKG